MKVNKLGLIFDVDGVIADSEPLNAIASIKVFADLFNLHGVKEVDFEAGLGRGAEAYMKAAATCHGLELKEAELAEAVQQRQDNLLELIASRGLPAYPGVRELMNEATGSPDFLLAIATSGSREISGAIMRSAGVPFERAVWITGSEIKRRKPDPELFLTAAKGLALPPQRCLVIEDSPSGVEAALAAGCKCLAVTNTTSRQALSAATRVIGTLSGFTLQDARTLIGA